MTQHRYHRWPDNWLTFRRLALAGACLLATLGPVRAQGLPQDPVRMPPAPMNERDIMLPGDPARPVELQVTLFAPSGPGPFPLAVLNHGAAEDGKPRDLERYRFTFSADYFLSRGYAVVLPMMRGFAGSGGDPVNKGCDLAAVGLDDAQDIRAVIDYMVRLPWIDPNRIVVEGQSFGGWNTLAFGALGYPHVMGLVNFNGGMLTSACPDSPRALAVGAARFGAMTKIPSLWFYGDNDKLFPVPVWRSLYDAYRGAGGQAELVSVGTFMQDSHQLLSFEEGMPIWVPRLDAFLGRIGLPNRPIYPQYMPTPFPAPTHFAAIDDAGAVPLISDQQRDAYRKFLTLTSLPRVLAIGQGGVMATAAQGFDPIKRALDLCRTKAPACQIYAVDNDVVWNRPNWPAPAPAASAKAGATVAKVTVAATGTARIATFISVKPGCISRGPTLVRITRQPNAGTLSVRQTEDFPHFDPGNANVACNSTKIDATALDYTPNPGASGTDAFDVEETSPDGLTKDIQILVTLK